MAAKSATLLTGVVLVSLLVGHATALAQNPANTAVLTPVEKGELSPVMASDGSGLPFELWRGVDIALFEKLISELEIPPRSPALHQLWKRLITSDVTPPAGEAANQKFRALRLEALYRSGLSAEAKQEVDAIDPAAVPMLAVLASRNALANGDNARACEMSAKAKPSGAAAPKRVKAESLLISAYCAAISGDTAGAGLAAELAREEGLGRSAALDALDAIATRSKPKTAPYERLTLADYKLLELADAPAAAAQSLEKAEPALLIAIANDSKAPAGMRISAAEAAARQNSLDPEGLAALYALGINTESADALLTGGTTKGTARRAALYKAIEAEKTPMKRTRLIRALLDDAKRNGLGSQVARMLGRPAAALKPAPELVWFAETAAEIGLASGNFEMTRNWVALSPPGTTPGLAHWLTLADIADTNFQPRGAHLKELESSALTGRFQPEALHRLATVLDALEYAIPIPLWEAASRSPQPGAGYLPETGVLTALQDAAKKKEFGHTVLLAMKAMGPNGAEGAHLIALGDSMRALKRAGLEADARRLALEALLASWPRTAAN